MSDERRKTGERRRPASVSVRRLEGKIDQVAKRQDDIVRRQDEMYLNGDAVALRDLARFWRESGPALASIVAAAPTIIAAVHRDNDTAAFWRVTRRFLNPLKPAGALAWTVIGTIAAALLWNFLVALNVTPHPH